MKEYLTSDWHSFHKRIVGEEGFVKGRRRFSFVEYMNSLIIWNTNLVVTDDDIIYHLGDIGINVKESELFEWLKQINGQIVLIKGNHDHKKLLNYIKRNNYKLPNGKDKFVIHDVGIILKRNGKSYYLSHFPMVFGDYRSNLRSFYGHYHDEPFVMANGLNVGVDSLEIGERPFGEPVELGEAIALLENKWETFKDKASRLMK